MSERERFEKAGAEREARAASIHRTGRGPVSRNIQAALAHYLAAEAYRELEPTATEQHPLPRRTRQR